jgi:hypothetical protein
MTGSRSRTATAHDDGAKRQFRRDKCLFAARVRGEEAVSKTLVRGTQIAYEAVVEMGKGTGWPEARKSSGFPRMYMRRIYGVKVTRLTPGDLSARSYRGGKSVANKGSRKVNDGQAEVSRIHKLSAHGSVGGTE